MNTEEKKPKVREWKTTGSFKTFEEADTERNLLVADGIKTVVRKRSPEKFDVKVCIKEVK